MKQIYLDTICNSDSILKNIKLKITEMSKISDDTLKHIIEEACLDRLCLLEKKHFTENNKSLEVINNPITKNFELEIAENIVNDIFLSIILETIGETGLSRIAELKEIDKFKRNFINFNGEFNQGTLSKKIKELIDIEVIDVEQINTGRKGGYENIYTLSALGKYLYTSLFSKKPIPSDKEVIQKQYSSLEHGYFTKTVAVELKNKGYDVFITKQFSNNKDNIFTNNIISELTDYTDLIITKDNVSFYINCELGLTSDEILFRKISKLINYTNTLSFIMNNQESLNKIASKVDKWITKQGRDNLSGYTFRFTTIDTVKKKEVWINKGPF